MGNIQCSKCGIPASYYDYSPEKMSRQSCNVPDEYEKGLKQCTYEHKWIDYWRELYWSELLWCR